MKKYLLDTNVLLRFLLDEHPEPSVAAARLFQQAADEKCLLILTDLGIAEAVWVPGVVAWLCRKRRCGHFWFAAE